VFEVHIRPYRRDDAPAIWEAARESLAELHSWMPWVHPRYSVEESRAWLDVQIPAFKQGTAFEFAIVSEKDRFLGGCGLNQIDAVNRRANLGYWVRSSATRQGIATQAIQMVRDWGFAHTDLLRLEIVIAVGNIASQRAAQKSGAVAEGVLRQRLMLHGVPHDATVSSFTRP
jgi:ribosomal-protein-serine acetyltransferase